MVQSLIRELKKIIAVSNNNKFEFVFKYGIIKAWLFTVFISLIFIILSAGNIDIKFVILDLLLKVLIATLPGYVWGIVDYQMYKDIIDNVKKMKISNVLYIFLYGFLGWGILCSVCNMTFIPFDNVSIISAIITLPVYGIVLGIVSLKTLNKKLIKQLYLENIKGKNIKSVKRNKSVLEMR